MGSGDRLKMNEQDYLQRIRDILADNAHEMCAIDGDAQDIIFDVNMDGVQTVAREICNVFKPMIRSLQEQIRTDTRRFANIGTNERRE